MADPIYFAEPNTDFYYAVRIPVVSSFNAFQIGAFQQSAFQIHLGGAYTYLTFEPNTDFYYAVRREGT